MTDPNPYQSFSYTNEETAVFYYLRTYMSKIKPKIPELQDEAFKRFMVAGLFLAYRGANHRGESLSTGETDQNSESPGDDRVIYFRRFAGFRITSTEKYLEILGGVWRFYIPSHILGIGRQLYRYVLYGKIPSKYLNRK